MSDQQPRPKGEYPAKKVGKIIDHFLAEANGGKPREQPSADELCGWLGNALERWPNDFDPGDCDEVSHIIDILDQIANREGQ